ncbi:hypothetical protein TD95_004550 [Thielaviopsis punctulata]|uniref:Conserved oligomeric Golgi complex subunit 4 n=1 Tax=Thielaviopsis punctulata TaxID=72032 RepID=A0A0F4ZFJ8_9PEZI|nr:hypothetical protein TD95_004550 [Thielaviopsis punctulata]
MSTAHSRPPPTPGLTISTARPDSKPPTIADATDLTAVRAALSTLHQRDAALSARLDSLVASHADLSRDLARLDFLRATLGSQAIAVRSVGNHMLASAAATAGRLSDKVRELDLEKSRVEATLGVVEQVAELKACVNGVVGSMGAPQDWEAAAGYIARAGRIPESITRGGFAAAIVPSVEVPDAPWITLEQAKESLCGLFLREFEAAAEAGDAAKVTRFFKLFPLIGRGDVGLDIYGKFVCQGVSGTARATLKQASEAQKTDGFFYAGALTRLFEHIAQVVEGHGALVERHYGAGKMGRVIERLQQEVDVQGGIVLDSWSDERNVARRLTDVKSYPFSFLVQSFLPQQQRGAGGGAGAGGMAGMEARDSEDEGVNMKDVDALLGEMAMMLGRWALYTRFLAAKFKDPSAPDDTTLTLPPVLQKSNLHKKIAAKLITPYNVMSTFFFRRSVEKAFQLDEYPTGLSLSQTKPLGSSPPYIILAVDDVVFIVNAVIEKCLSTSQKEVVGSVLPTLARVLGADFVGMIQRKMRDESYPKPLVQGGYPPEDKIVAFIVLINSLDMANDYLARIVAGKTGATPEQVTAAAATTPPAAIVPTPSSPLCHAFPFPRDAAVVANQLINMLRSVSAKTTELMNEGLQVLFNNVVKLRLRPILAETFRDVDYSLSEADIEEIAELDGQDMAEMLEQVPRRFEHGWDSLMKPIARLLTAKTQADLHEMTARYLSRVLEKRIWSYAGRANAYGAIRMDKDFSGIVGAVARGNYSAREVFSKVSQILMAVNMEEEEWEEMVLAAEAGTDEGILWVLSEEERLKARMLVKAE